jgi:hypothetical protein
MEDGTSSNTCTVYGRTWTSTTRALNYVSSEITASVMSSTSMYCDFESDYPSLGVDVELRPILRTKKRVMLQCNAQLSQVTRERWLWWDTKRKTEINDSINNSFLSCLGLKLPINDSNNVFGFESLSMSRLCHLSRLCTRGYFSSKG